MKKTLLPAMALVLGLGLATAAHADDHKGKDGKHHKGDYKAKMMKKIDTNQDGIISKDEFMASSAKRFDKMDADGDGNLTKEEMKKHKEEMRKKFKEMRKKHKEHKKDEMTEDKAEDAPTPAPQATE